MYRKEADTVNMGAASGAASMQVREGWEWGKSVWKLKNPGLIPDSRFQTLYFQNYKGINTFFQKDGWFVACWFQQRVDPEWNRRMDFGARMSPLTCALLVHTRRGRQV